jgi:cysteinyl-tRNA synthetase
VGGEADKDYLFDFNRYTLDDLDTPKALALVYELVDNKDIDPQKKHRTVLEIDRVLALGLVGADAVEKILIPDSIMRLLRQREEARKVNDWKRADDLRVEIKDRGYIIKDTNNGPEIKKKQKLGQAKKTILRPSLLAPN